MEVTLRGLRVLNHPKNPEELRGVVVPWERVACVGNGQTGQVAALRVYREDGTEVKRRGLLPTFRPESHEGAVARRAIKRRWKQLIASRDFTVIERFEHKQGGRVCGVMAIVFMIAGCGYCLGLMLPGVFQGFGQLSVQLKLLTLVVGAAMALMIGVMPAVALVLFRQQWRRNVTEIGINADGFEAVLRDGRHVSCAWGQVRALDERFGTIGIVLDDGPRLFLSPARTRLVLRHQRERLEPQRKEHQKAANKRLLIRGLVYFQLGGTASAGAMIWVQQSGAAAGGAMGPIGTYLMVGFGLPLMMALQLAAPYGIAWLDKWQVKRKKRRGRAATAGRVVE